MKGLHHLSDIYVIGGGKSLDYIPKSFLSNKICVFVNHSVSLGFKGCVNYLIAKEPNASMQHDANAMGATMVFCKYKCGAESGVLNEILYDYVLFRPLKGSVETREIGCLERTASTITSGIHLALHLGASNVLLLGHDCRVTDGETHASGYPVGRTPRDRYMEWMASSGMVSDTQRVIDTAMSVWGGVPVVSICPFDFF